VFELRIVVSPRRRPSLAVFWLVLLATLRKSLNTYIFKYYFRKQEKCHIRKFSFTTTFSFAKILSVKPETSTEREIAEALRAGTPLRDIAGVSIRNVRRERDQAFDISFELQSGANRVQVLGEIKPTFSPRILEEIAPWIRRLRSLRPDVSVAVIAPALSPQTQAVCIQREIDFIDLAGNVSINVPGKFTLQRTGIRPQRELAAPAEGSETTNVFSGRSSRILRVLLQKPKSWNVTEIARELSAETSRFATRFPKANISFEVSIGAVSKAVASLEEQVLVRRRGTAVLVPEPVRLLQQWGEKYKERYRWRLRSSFQTNNPFGNELDVISRGLESMTRGAYAFTGALAVKAAAPFVDIDSADVFIADKNSDSNLRELKTRPSVGPKLRFIYPYDDGVFMYASAVDQVPVVSEVQAYLDLYARGGRDLKQADYLLRNVIQLHWGAA
jgi:hypothetical protein